MCGVGQVSSSPNYQHSTTLGVFSKHCLGFGKNMSDIVVVFSVKYEKRLFARYIVVSICFSLYVRVMYTSIRKLFYIVVRFL